MPDYYHTLRNVLITALLPVIAAGSTNLAQPALAEQTLQNIRDCMARSPAPWADEWNQEYVETIRSAVKSQGDVQQYAVRLEILREGFGPYWESLNKSKDRSVFEVHLAAIRWYTEHLMGTKLLSRDERHKLRNQYKDLWNYAARSLLMQFPFLDPSAVQGAKADHLSQCYLNIEAPLPPIYLHPLSEAQVDKIKQRWGDLRYARVDMWRSLGGDAIMAVDKEQLESPRAHPSLTALDNGVLKFHMDFRRVYPTVPDRWLGFESRPVPGRQYEPLDILNV